MTSTTTGHPVDKGTAHYLCGGKANTPAPGGALVVALAECMQALRVVNTGEGFALQAEGVDLAAWADVFGVMPYRAGRVALAKSTQGPWAAAQRRLPSEQAHRA